MDNFEIIIYIIIIIASFVGSFVKKKRQEEHRRAQMSRSASNEELFYEISDDESDEDKVGTWADVVVQWKEKTDKPKPEPDTKRNVETKMQERPEVLDTVPPIGNMSSNNIYDQDPGEKYFSDAEDLKRAIINAEILNRKY